MRREGGERVVDEDVEEEEEDEHEKAMRRKAVDAGVKLRPRCIVGVVDPHLSCWRTQTW